MFEVWEGKCGWVIFEINKNMSLDFVLNLGDQAYGMCPSTCAVARCFYKE